MIRHTANPSQEAAPTMKKMIPVYLLLLALLGSAIFTARRFTQHLAVIESELAAMRREQIKVGAGPQSPYGSVLRVYIANEPTVRIEDTVDVRIKNQPVSVSVDNTPDVRVAN